MKTKDLFFKTVDLHLAAGILSEVAGTYLSGVDRAPAAYSNKRIILIHYLEGSEAELENVKRAFRNRTLTVCLSRYMSALNQIRDLIHSHTENNGRRLQGIEING